MLLPLPLQMEGALLLMCQHCDKPAPELRCSRCRAAYYCSSACQRAAWKAGHKAACAAAVKVQEEGGDQQQGAGGGS